MDNLIYETAKELFGCQLGGFDQHWRDGWRPALDTYIDTEGVIHDDIIFRSPLGSYCRARSSEQGSKLAFRQLEAALIQEARLPEEDANG